LPISDSTGRSATLAIIFSGFLRIHFSVFTAVA